MSGIGSPALLLSKFYQRSATGWKPIARRSPFGVRVIKTWMRGPNPRMTGEPESMPTIAYFYGIAIRMFFVDHPPPHFFATYSGHEANVSIETGEVMEGHLPANAARLVKQWALAHRGELEDNWRRARASQPLVKIAGLDDD
ncbi:MAG TPA: DUF4160 domain-containing protein [Bradyrhizobium sp.]